MKQYTCWLCGQKDKEERLEPETSPGGRKRYAHLECKEEAAYLLDDFLKYELKEIRG